MAARHRRRKRQDRKDKKYWQYWGVDGRIAYHHHDGQPTRRAFKDEAVAFDKRKGRYVWEPVN